MLKYIASIILVIILLGFPVISGYASTPKSLEPKPLGMYIAGTFEYWVLVFLSIINSINHSEMLNGGGN